MRLLSYSFPRVGSLRQALTHGLVLCGRGAGGLVFPWRCEVCGIEEAGLDGPFCTLCRDRLMTAAELSRKSSCPRCALSVGPFADLHGGCARCRRRSLGFDAAMALGIYEGITRDLCLRLKHERNAWLAPWLTDLLVEARALILTSFPAIPGWFQFLFTGGGA